MSYYHNLITRQSFTVLQSLTKEYDFILIGGWAVWLYTKGLKSKDIDIVIEFKELDKFKEKYDLTKNNRLKKYECKIEQISIDIYVPYYSDLGLKTEEIGKYQQNLQGFLVPEKEVLLILKQKAYEGRRLTVKGRKDFLDIITLLLLPDFDFKKYQKILRKYKIAGFKKKLMELLAKATDIIDLDLNRHKFSRIKKDLLNRLSS